MLRIIKLEGAGVPLKVRYLTQYGCYSVIGSNWYLSPGLE